METEAMKIALALMLAKYVKPDYVWDQENGEVTISAEVTLPKKFIMGMLEGVANFNKLLRVDDEKKNADLFNVVLAGCVQDGFCHWMESDTHPDKAKKVLAEMHKGES